MTYKNQYQNEDLISSRGLVKVKLPSYEIHHEFEGGCIVEKLGLITDLKKGRRSWKK